MKAMILAAGLGTRMRPLTDHLPKPLLPVAGKPLIVWHIEALAAAGVVDLVINAAHRAAQLQSALGDGSVWGVRIAWSLEEPPLETAGGLIAALPLLGERPFLVINGDVWWRPRWQELCAPLTAGDVARLTLVDNPAQHPAGDFHLQDGRVSEQGSPRLTFAGISLIDPALFSGLAAGVRPLAPVLRTAMQQGRVAGWHHHGAWVDVGTPQRLHDLTAALHAGTC